jgi:hypothetical protein
MAHAQTWCLHVGDGCFMPGCLQESWILCFDQSGDHLREYTPLADRKEA